LELDVCSSDLFTQQPWIVRMTLLQLFKERERLLMPVQPAQDVCAQVIKFLAILRFVRSFDEGARFLISFAVAEMTGKLQTDPSLFRKSGERLLQHPLQDRWILHPHRDMDHLLIQPAMIVVEIKRRAIVREGAREAAVCLI